MRLASFFKVLLSTTFISMAEGLKADQNEETAIRTAMECCPMRSRSYLMVRSLIPFVVVILLCTIASVSYGDDGNDQEAARMAFLSYRKAILASDGKAAVPILSQETIDYYGRMLQLALHGSKESVRRESISNKLLIFMLRSLVPLDSLRMMSPRDVVIYAVDQGWIGKNSVAQIYPGPITVTENVAIMRPIIRGRQSRQEFRFVKEDGSWKFDLLPILRSSNLAMLMLAKKMGLSEDEFLSQLFESTVGQKLSEDLWEPLLAESN